MTSAPNPRRPSGVLHPVDVRRIWSEEARKADPNCRDLGPRIVSHYLQQSRNANGRYADNPVPMPDGYSGNGQNGPWWYAEQEQDLRDWWNSRPGRGFSHARRPSGVTRAMRAFSEGTR
jgi:hypothetical protein